MKTNKQLNYTSPIITTDMLTKGEYIDLGLSVKWKSCNLGANQPYEYGNYYMWGSTTKGGDPNCKEQQYKKLTANDLTTNFADKRNQYDAAFIETNGKDRMPTKEEFEELINGTTYTKVYYFTDYGKSDTSVAGMLFTSKTNKNTIFIPYSGFRGGESIINDGLDTTLWSSSVDCSDNAWGLSCEYIYCCLHADFRYFGQSIRPVQNSTEQ